MAAENEMLLYDSEQFAMLAQTKPFPAIPVCDELAATQVQV